MKVGLAVLMDVNNPKMGNNFLLYSKQIDNVFCATDRFIAKEICHCVLINKMYFHAQFCNVVKCNLISITLEMFLNMAQFYVQIHQN